MCTRNKHIRGVLVSKQIKCNTIRQWLMSDEWDDWDENVWTNDCLLIKSIRLYEYQFTHMYLTYFANNFLGKHIIVGKQYCLASVTRFSYT